MRSRLTLWALLGLSCATPAAAQLASQTALVGTVTDSGNLVVPGAQVIAVNTGTKDTYETTTNSEGYYNIQFVRAGTYEITISLPGFQTFKATGVEVGQQPGRPHERGAQGRRPDRVGQCRSQSAGAEHRQRRRLGNDRQAGDRGTAAQRAQRLESRGTTPGVLAGINSDIGLSFRGAGQREIQNSLSLDGINSSANLLASTSMRPIADAVEEIQVQTGQHVGRVRVVSGRRDQRGHQERHQRAARVRLQLLQGRFAQCARMVREPGESEEPAAQQSVWLRDRGAGGDPGSL